jgi:uncharacterized protein (TIRG00374 family)
VRHSAEAAGMKARARFLVLLLAGLVVGGLCAALALREISMAKLNAVLQAAELLWAAPFLLALFAFYWIKTLRWCQLLAPLVRVRTRELFAPVMIGYAGSALLPMQLGDVARSAIAAKQLRQPAFAMLVSIALERLFDLLGILFILAVALVLFRAQMPQVVITAGFWLTLAIGAAALLGAAYVFFTPAFVRVTRVLAQRLPPTVTARLVAQVERGVHGLAAVRDLRLTAAALTTSLLQWLLMWCCVWLSLEAVAINLPPVAGLVVLVLTVIGISLPSTPGYFGSIQLAYVLALKPFGIDAENAFAASLFFHALAYPAVIIAGFALLPSARVDWPQLRNSTGL